MYSKVVFAVEMAKLYIKQYQLKYKSSYQCKLEWINFENGQLLHQIDMCKANGGGGNKILLPPHRANVVLFVDIRWQNNQYRHCYQFDWSASRARFDALWSAICSVDWTQAPQFTPIEPETIDVIESARFADGDNDVLPHVQRYLGPSCLGWHQLPVMRHVSRYVALDLELTCTRLQKIQLNTLMLNTRFID